MYEETEFIPAVVLGLDTQGGGRYLSEVYLGEDYYYNFDRYEHKAWGVYAVLSKNWNLLGNLGFHLGVNKNTFETKDNDSSMNLFFGFDNDLF